MMNNLSLLKHECPNCGKETYFKYCSYACGLKAEEKKVSERLDNNEQSFSPKTHS